MSAINWKKKVIRWLDEGLKGSEIFTPEAWDIKEVEKNKLIINSTALTYNITLRIEDKFIIVAVYTGIETAILDKDERLKIYRKMLIANDELRLVKLVLHGRNDELVVRTDLDLATLGKVEFFDALISVIIGAERLSKILGLEKGEKEESEELTRALVSLLKEMGRDRVIDLLVTKGGMSKEEAEALVEMLIKRYHLEPPAPMYG